MRINLLRSAVLFASLFLQQGSIYSQRPEEWSNFIPLKSTRTEVEKILGKPDMYFATYGSYKTPYGQYSVWYADGHCKNRVEGRDWNVDRGLLTVLLVQPYRVNLVKDYLSNISDFQRTVAPYSRIMYLSKDGSLVYEAIQPADNAEFISAISFQPDHSKDNLICKKGDSGSK